MRSSSPIAAPRPPRFFVVVPYVLHLACPPTPSVPTVGPCHDWDRSACRISIHHYRNRKTGPCFALAVVRCRAHRVAFTLYPPGYVPYARTPLERVASEGQRVRGESQPGEGCAGDSPGERFEATSFQAAVDASQGRAWSRESTTGSSWWPTQGKQLQRCLQLMVLDPGSGSRTRERLSSTLGVGTLHLHEQANRVGGSVGYRERGAAVMAMLAEMDKASCVLERLLESGYMVGLWGKPGLWKEREERLVEPPF